MINSNNLKETLKALGFVSGSDGDFLTKEYQNVDATMSVDFEKKQLIFSKLIEGRDRNVGFDRNENFVVFECVDRLLTKGYRPENIQLEKEWHLGHDAKSGRADICVTDERGLMLFIVECKTWGKEFDKAKKDTLNDGAQLFSYWQQEQSTRWLVLYASDFKNNEITYKAPTIDCSDDANILLLAKKDKSLKLYRDSHTTSEKFEAWKETYANQMHEDLVFSEDSVAYKIGVKPLRKKNLRDFTPDDKIVNKFEEILRHNNVSDKENAFNRLIALFICKLVDESTKDENDEVEFQYKQGTDTYETLQDRLQRLHRDGMEKFMREEIYYVSADYPERLFANYTGSKRRKAIEDLQNTIRILKFYSNNDFAFKDVHNEELFYQNGKILVEMVQLFEKYRIVYPSKHQFLGDLFEQLLNKGFKQNEGQFFTPMPITRFIWDSLPVDRMIKSERGAVYPKVIDYACGAGHFLTEAVEAINFFTKNDGNNAWVKDHIFGIEKDYRLARVAKISLFMNGAGEGNIIFGDGLENSPDKGIDNGIFDILVANPPYSVKDFKQHLQLKNNNFELLNCIGLNGGEIETLFVERIAQLLKPKGVAAVVLPSSILSNDSSSYTGAREMLLKNFNIRAIVVFRSKTFGATGTSTVVLFLEKYNEPPKIADLSSDSVQAIFSGIKLTDWKDKDILNAYLEQIELDENIYAKFLRKDFSLEELAEVKYFKMYVNAFADSAEAKSLKKTKTFKSKSAEDQKAEYLLKLYDFTNSVEAEKLFYFSLVYQQKTVIIKAPEGNKEQKKFLGYDWSNRKGNEGIQIINKGGQLYDDVNRSAKDTLAHVIRQSFNDVAPTFPEDKANFGTVVNTKDMLDFSRESFGKSIILTASKKIECTSKFDVIQLSALAEISKGSSITQAETTPGKYKVVAGGRDFAYTHNMFNREAGIITVSASGANAGFVNYWEEEIFASDCTTIKADKNVTTKWIYYYLKMIQEQIFEVLQKGSSQPHVYAEDLKLIPIPLISIKLQTKIVNKCSKIDDEYNTTRMSIENYRKKIEDLFNDLEVIASEGGVNLVRLSEICLDIFAGGDAPADYREKPDSEYYVPIYSNGTAENALYGYGKEPKVTEDAITISARGTIGFTEYRKAPFIPIVRLIVLIPDTDKVNVQFLKYSVKCLKFENTGKTTPQLTVPNVRNLKIKLPLDPEKQNEIISRVNEIEAKITEAEKKLEGLKNKTGEIVKSYLS